MSSLTTSPLSGANAEYLVEVIQEISLAKNLEEIVEIARHAARKLTGADGVSFILRDEDKCFYMDEDAISPLWKGCRFPMTACISGWSMIHSETVVIPDIYVDDRIPHDTYRPTFVKSLLMVPVRKSNPIGAIGAYWANEHAANEIEIRLLENLANCVAISLYNVQLISKLTEANYSLEKSLFSRDEFISIASHELRTPITAIKLELQMVSRSLKDVVTESSKEPLARSLNDVDRLTNLVEQLLDVTRVSMGRLVLNKTKVHAHDVVEKTVLLLTPQLHKVNSNIELDLEPNVECFWDTVRIEQILTNLISNVARHAPGSDVKLSLRKESSDVVIHFSDNGPGVSLEAQSRLFKRFEKGKSSNGVGGLGLGLYILKSLVEAHNGTLELSTQTGGGTRFKITLPCVSEVEGK